MNKSKRYIVQHDLTIRVKEFQEFGEMNSRCRLDWLTDPGRGGVKVTRCRYKKRHRFMKS